eukprot:c6726_g1_i2 orf=341-1966(+)
MVCLLSSCVLLLSFLSSFADGQLKADFYASTCANVASTVTNTIKTLSTSDNVVPPATLRLLVHDCFVQGCDASILIKSTQGNKAERDATENANIATNAFDAVIRAKQAVDAICPGVVSCADVLALAARDAVVFLGGPTWDVPLGRRDGLVSEASLVPGHLPGSNLNVAQLVANFGSLGLTVEDLVILSGGHTIGFSHCDQFTNRLYSFNTTVKTDPTLDPGFAKQLEQKCPQGGADAFQAFDIVSPFTFDNQYYKNLQDGKGLLFSDEVLFTDNATKDLVNSFAASQVTFFQSFVGAMIKMSSIGVKTGSDGEIRKDCTAFNTGVSSSSPPSNSSSTPAQSPPVAPSPLVVPPKNFTPSPQSTPPGPPPGAFPPNSSPPFSFPPPAPTPFASPTATPPVNTSPGPNPNFNPPQNSPFNNAPAAPSTPLTNPNPPSNPASPPPNPTSPNTPIVSPSPSGSSDPSPGSPGVVSGSPFNPSTPDAPGSNPSSPPGGNRFPRFPFHLPRIPGFPRNPGTPGSSPSASATETRENLVSNGRSPATT